MRLALVVVVGLVAGCGAAAPASSSDASAMDASSPDVGTVVHTCADAMTATSTVTCFNECTTDVACDFTDSCSRAGCPAVRVYCASERVRIYVSGAICDTGPRSLDAGTDADDSGASVVHTCDAARSMLAGRDCRFGCDAGGTPCDFTGQCCIAPSVFVACEAGQVVTTELGGDAGPCDFDASLPHDAGG